MSMNSGMCVLFSGCQKQVVVPFCVFSRGISAFGTVLSFCPAAGDGLFLCQVVFLCGEPADTWRKLTPRSPLNFCIAANTFDLMPAALAAH